MNRWMHRVLLVVLAIAAGCTSPYHADRGALTGGLLGAGTGAIVGNALGNTGAGAAIGAGIGALAGGAIGHGMDEVEANNRAAIAAHMGREVPYGTVTVGDVISMTQAGVNEDLIVNHIRANGMIRSLETQDLIVLKEQGVSAKVISAMQESPRVARAQRVYIERPARPVIIHHYDPWYYRRPYVHYSYGCW